MWYHIVWWKFTYVTEELSISIIYVKDCGSSFQILLNINQNAWCHIPQDGYFIVTPVKTSVLKAKTCMRAEPYNMN